MHRIVNTNESDLFDAHKLREPHSEPIASERRILEGIMSENLHRLTSLSSSPRIACESGVKLERLHGESIVRRRWIVLDSLWPGDQALGHIRGAEESTFTVGKVCSEFIDLMLCCSEPSIVPCHLIQRVEADGKRSMVIGEGLGSGAITPRPNEVAIWGRIRQEEGCDRPGPREIPWLTKDDTCFCEGSDRKPIPCGDDLVVPTWWSALRPYESQPLIDRLLALLDLKSVEAGCCGDLFETHNAEQVVGAFEVALRRCTVDRGAKRAVLAKDGTEFVP